MRPYSWIHSSSSVENILLFWARVSQTSVCIRSSWWVCYSTVSGVQSPKCLTQWVRNRNENLHFQHIPSDTNLWPILGGQLLCSASWTLLHLPSPEHFTNRRAWSSRSGVDPKVLSNKLPLWAVWLHGSAQNIFSFFLRGRGPPPSSISVVAKLVCMLESRSNLQNILVPHVRLWLVWGTAWPWEF